MIAGKASWPHDFVERYRRAGYWRGVTLGDAIIEAALRDPAREALVDGARRTTYGELAAKSERLAHHLVERGICGGARVVFQLPNTTEFVVAYLACLRVGAVPIACLPTHRHTEIGHLARHAEAAAWLVPSEFRGFDFVRMVGELRAEIPSVRHVLVAGPRAGDGMTRLDDLLSDPIEDRAAKGALDAHRPSPSDAAVFQLSGGTTGLPKIIPRTHDDYLYNSLCFAGASGLDRDSVLLVAVPIAHNFPLACPGLQGALLLGARVVLAPSPSPEVVFPLIAKERVTWIPAVPATAIAWLNDKRRAEHDLRSIRTLAVGGQRLNPEPARAVVDAFGPVLMQVYGMAEGLLCCTRPGDPADVVVETQGRPASPGDEIRVVGDDGRPVAPGELGELQTRGPYTIRGYYRADDYNRTAFTPDGFYKTGDLVRLHPSGNIVVEGRSKDVINRGGEKVGAEELENAILGHDAVHNVAVVGMPDAVLGERVCAFVVLKADAGVTLGELRAFLSPRMASYKLPERLELRLELPQTSVGKISKKALREEISALLTAQASVP